jgi:hypothetical protein
VVAVRAELAGKLSMSSPSRQDRLEDTLTDGVFSALRYLPREVLARWLTSVLPAAMAPQRIDVAVNGARFEFWPTLPGGSEPDVMITVGSLLVIVEAKYHSPFGKGWGRHQLAVEWEQGRRFATSSGLEGPVVVAITSHLVEPDDINSARAQLPIVSLEAICVDATDAVVWCRWQSVAEAIEASDQAEWGPGDRAVAHYVLELMKRRGVRYMYEGFRTADWWLLAAAADAATERVYPTVAEFAKELTAHGARAGPRVGRNRLRCRLVRVEAPIEHAPLAP